MDIRLGGGLTLVLPIEDSSQIGHARRTAQSLAEQSGFDAVDSGRVALVVTELASNILKHASNGELHLRVLNSSPLGIEVIAIDRGAGFDPQDCLVDGFSTRGTQGIGLGSILRQAQVFDVHTDSRGTVLLTRFYPRSSVTRDVRAGFSQHSLYNDPACGDAWEVAISDKQISVLVIDGLGHGPEAEDAAKAGVCAFNRDPFAHPDFMLEELHHDMRGTRGGAVAIAQFDANQNILRFIGIGNIGATLVATDKTRGIASHPGIVGLQYRKIRVTDYPECAGALLILYSDGLQSRWNLRDYPGLIFRHPAVIAAVLHRDYCRGRDDVTVVVIALERADD